MPACVGPGEMRPISSDALILRTYRYGEADRIVVFLTEDRGKKRGVAKNATNSRRRFGAALEPLTLGRATYVERDGRELVRLDRVEPRATPMSMAAGRPVDEGAHVLGHAAYFAELLDEWAPDASPNGRLFRLGVAAGEVLGRAGSVEALARYFEVLAASARRRVSRPRRLPPMWPVVRRRGRAGACRPVVRLWGLRARRSATVGRRDWISEARRGLPPSRRRRNGRPARRIAGARARAPPLDRDAS